MFFRVSFRFFDFLESFCVCVLVYVCVFVYLNNCRVCLSVIPSVCVCGFPCVCQYLREYVCVLHAYANAVVLVCV